MKFLKKVRSRVILSAGGKWLWAVVAALVSGMVWMSLCQLVESQSIRWTLGALLTSNAAFWLSGLFLGLLILGAELLSHSFFVGNLLVGVPAMLLTFVNYYKMLITSTPLTIGDFALAGQVGNIAALNSQSLYLDRNSVLAIVCAVLWLLIALFFSAALRIRWRWSAAGGVCAGLAFFLLFWVGADPAIFTPLGVNVDLFISQSAANQSCGTLLGLWRSHYVRSTLGFGGDATPEEMAQVVGRARAYTAQNPAPAQREKPNVILILSESFFDVTRLDGVAFPTDPLADFHALQKESVSGTFYSRSLGYGTCNVELEIMTGLNTGLITGDNLYSCPPETFSYLPALPALLGEDGYYTSLLHMFNDAIYNRQILFQYLGFQDMYFSEDFAQFYPPAAGAEDYWGYMRTRISGEFYSDDLMSDLLVAQYEKMSGEYDGPLFLYASSMEGHQPYPADKYRPDELTVAPASQLTGEAADALRTFSQCAANASAALGKLVDYFRTCDEPTVIIFYGDHRPGLGLATGGTVYSELGLAPASSTQWEIEDHRNLFSTDYLIWSNDPSYLPGEPGGVLDTSGSYLGAQILEITGTRMPLYWKVIDRLSQTRVADTIEFHLDRKGQITNSQPIFDADVEGLSILRSFVGDTLYGKHYAAEQIGG